MAHTVICDDCIKSQTFDTERIAREVARLHEDDTCHMVSVLPVKAAEPVEMTEHDRRTQGKVRRLQRKYAKMTGPALLADKITELETTLSELKFMQDHLAKESVS